MNELLSRLDGVVDVGHNRWKAKCPAHEDNSPSLSLRLTDDGKSLVKCFAGCDTESVVDAVGLNITDLFPDRPDYKKYQNKDYIPIDYPAILRAIKMDVLLVWVIAVGIRQGRPLTDKDEESLIRASNRIDHVLKGCPHV